MSPRQELEEMKRMWFQQQLAIEKKREQLQKLIALLGEKVGS